MSTTEERYIEAGMLPPTGGERVSPAAHTTDELAAVVALVEGSAEVVEPGEDDVFADSTTTPDLEA